jgi:hypothetical protein
MPSAGRVSRACARCRRQKLRCDAELPCTLCVRAGVECQPRATFGRAKHESQAKQLPDNGVSNSANTQHPKTSPRANSRHDAADANQRQLDVELPEHSPSETQQFGANSSAINFAHRVFRDNNISSSEIRSTIPGDARSSLHLDAVWTLKGMERPPPPLLAMLVDTYLERVQWFICLFHGPSFRSRTLEVLAYQTWTMRQMPEVVAILMTAAYGLKCVLADSTWTGHTTLRAYSLDGESLLANLIAEVKLHLIELLDRSQIETVQVCLLLGTFYIYNGSPSLAWSVLGMAVRTGYAMSLHCDAPEYAPAVEVEVRYRCWNHITVADAFATMIYGRPTGLDGAFANFHGLRECDDMVLGNTHSRETDGIAISKVTYHMLKFRMYAIIRRAISQLRLLRLSNPLSKEDAIALADAVRNIEAKLVGWHEAVPSWLSAELWQRISSGEPYPPDLKVLASLSSDDARELCLQSLMLQLAYDGAIILVRRSLIEHQVKPSTLNSTKHETKETVMQSLDVAVDAAIRISRVPLSQLKGQLCLSFAFMHFFTAGVILCIYPAKHPFSTKAQEAKAATKRIILASREFQDSSQIARHIDELLTGLLRTTVLREMDNALLSQNATAAPTPAPAASRGTEETNLLRAMYQNSETDVWDNPLPVTGMGARDTPNAQPEDSGATSQPYLDGIMTNTMDGNFYWPNDISPGFYSQIDEAFGSFGQSRCPSLVPSLTAC